MGEMERKSSPDHLWEFLQVKPYQLLAETVVRPVYLFQGLPRCLWKSTY